MHGLLNLAVHALPWPILLGQAENYRHLGRRFQPGGSTFGAQEVGLAVALLIAPIVLATVLARLMKLRREQQRHSVHALFRELCRAHGLVRRDQNRLRRLARRLHLKQPAIIFLDPQYLESAEAQAESQQLRDEIRGLRERIFRSSTLLAA